MASRGLVLPRQQAAAPSPTASTSNAASKQQQAGPVNTAEDAIKHFADGNLQDLINAAKQGPGASPGPSNAASPAPSNAAAGEDGASVAKGLPTPTLQNMVATVDLGTRLDLKSIALHARNAEYNPKRFAAVIMRIREPKTTALVFASGKMVVTGAKSEDESKLAARKFARIIQKLGFDAKFQEFKIQNVVGSVDVKFPIRLEGLAYAHGHFSSYEPELFPGLIYRMVKPRVVLLIFVSGKVVLTGARTRQDVYTAFQTIYPVLAEFRKS